MLGRWSAAGRRCWDPAPPPYADRAELYIAIADSIGIEWRIIGVLSSLSAGAVKQRERHRSQHELQCDNGAVPGHPIFFAGCIDDTDQWTIEKGLGRAG